MIVYIIAALLVFGVLIAVHELGHFLAAKACGVRVNEFAIGMGPALWKKQKGETLYALRAIPCGGFCAMEGEEEDSDDPHALYRQGFWAKLLIFAAGAIMNFLAGLVILLLLYSGAKAFYDPTITAFAEGCPLQAENGLQVGDTLLSIDGERVYMYSDVGLLLNMNHDGTFDLVVRRNGEKVTLTDFPMEKRAYTDQSGSSYTGYGLFFGVKEATWRDRIANSWNNAMDFVRLVRLSLNMLLRGQAGIRDVGGPVMIVQQMAQVADESSNLYYAMMNLVYFGAFLAINLAVMNLLPIPALDGGRVVCLLLTTAVEALTHKKIDPKYEAYLHGAGMTVLMLLMALIMFKDIIFLFMR